MIISHSDLLREAKYEDILATEASSFEPDAIQFELEILEISEVLAIECLQTGEKRIFGWAPEGRREEVDICGPDFASWSTGVKRKISELFRELAKWETNLRRPGYIWDIRLLADPNLTADDLADES